MPQTGFEPMTFSLQVKRINHFATRAMYDIQSLSILFLLVNKNDKWLGWMI